MKGQVQKTNLQDCVEILPTVFADPRGQLVKTYHAQWFLENGMDFLPAECFFSQSKKGVVRGLHFQLPPADHHKLVSCIQGEVMDVALDLRVGSPTYLQHQCFVLSQERHNALFLPKGFAHGFVTYSEDSVMHYMVSSIHNPALDTGILWDSCGISWGIEAPVLSERDQSFLPLCDFKSPFVWEETP